MPAFSRDKYLWERAKNKALATHAESDDDFYPVVIGIYKRLGGKIDASSASAADIIRASDAVRCRASFGADVQATEEKPWKQGEEVVFVYLPEGKHAITAGFRNGSIKLNVVVDSATADAVQSSLDDLRAERPRQRPYGCVEHREQEASVIAKAFNYEEGRGVLLTAEPTRLGADNVNGKVHWSWSPSFTTDAEYDKCKCSCGDDACACNVPILVFPDGARGSASNPARVTGVDFVLGTLTNRPAFREMPPVKSKEGVQSGAVQATWSDAARDAAREARQMHQHKIKQAHDASFNAELTGDHEAHRHAAELHSKLASHLRDSDNALDRLMKTHHEQLATYHKQQIQSSNAFHATAEASKLSKAANESPSRESHQSASEAHEDAARQHRNAAVIAHQEGRNTDELDHQTKADFHRMEGARHSIESFAHKKEVKASDANANDTIQAKWSDEAREAALEARRSGGAAHKATEALQSAAEPSLERAAQHQAAGNAHVKAMKAHFHAAFHHPDEKESKQLQAHAAHHAELAKHHFDEAKKNRFHVKGTDADDDDAIKAVGSEDVMNDTVKAAWSDQARAAALAARKSNAHSETAFAASEKANNATHTSMESDDADHESVALLHHAAAKLHHEAAIEHSSKGNAKEASGHGLVAKGHIGMSMLHRQACARMKPSAKASESIHAAGTSEGVKKSWDERRKKKSPFAHMQALTNAGISPEQYAKERHAPTRKEIEDAAEFYHKSGDLKEEHYGGGNSTHATDKPELNRVLAKLAESTTATNNVLQKIVDERPSAEEICARIRARTVGPLTEN